MKRRDIFKTAGLAGLATIVHNSPATAAMRGMLKTERSPFEGCVLIPSETRGPYPLDLSKDATKFRRVINEDKTGLPLSLTLTIVNVNNNCAPMPNVRVDVWHCDKDGVYSGYNQPGANTQGQTFCRGIQITDSNGQARFDTIYPGWYAGRITHIHFEMYLSSVLNATSQCAFPDEITKAVYATPMYSMRGQNTSVASIAADNVFSNGTQYQMLSITENKASGGYDGSLTVGIAAPVTGLIDIEPETGGQFKLLTNTPNPFLLQTSIPFVLNNDAIVKLELFDVHGAKVMTLLHDHLLAGEHRALLNRESNGMRLSTGSYVYQLTVENSLGRFCQCKVLTAE